MVPSSPTLTLGQASRGMKKGAGPSQPELAMALCSLLSLCRLLRLLDPKKHPQSRLDLATVRASAAPLASALTGSATPGPPSSRHPALQPQDNPVSFSYSPWSALELPVTFIHGGTLLGVPETATTTAHPSLLFCCIGPGKLYPPSLRWLVYPMKITHQALRARKGQQGHLLPP